MYIGIFTPYIKEVFNIIADAVFEGGGIRGIGYVGALNYMEECGYRWVRAAGTSVGALIASLLTAGYTARELKKILIQTNFEKFRDRRGYRSIPIIGKPLGVLVENSIYSGDYVEKWVEELLDDKGVETFGDISENGESPLKIIVSDITRRCMVILPDDLVNYGTDPMEFPIAKAVRMSISIPFYFKPVKLRYKNIISLIVDGCICCNYPINIFDVQGVPRWPTIGFKFSNNGASFTSTGRTDTLSFLMDVAHTMSQGQLAEHMLEKNKVRSIEIPTAGVEVTDFDISKEQIYLLYKYGYRSAMEFLKRWNFDEYVSKYRLEN
ncbi:patatin-like phospholipase family protein [Clostridium thermarum]|uniref:patatin-like phospholipase family protein n=1 Tax=Clostridium thermarum TaxID=1716543 RepID=UPI001FAE0E1A|nr:patatin-like phospholipase family protein [Clostridium thermarum]